MKVKKKLLFYILGSIAIFVLSLLGPFYIQENGQETISLIVSILRLPKDILWQHNVESAFCSGITMWLYLLMPVVACIPSASFVYEELKSKFFMNTEFRKGRYRYVYSRFVYSAVSAAAIVIIGLTLHALFAFCIFPLNPIGEPVEIGVWEMISRIYSQIIPIALYGMAMSVVATFLVYLYPNLYVNLSLVFIISYVLREIAMRENVIFLVIMLGMFVLYGIMWKFRSEHI